MSAVVEDIVQTRLDVAGLGEWTTKFGTATKALGLLDDGLDEIGRKNLGRAFVGGAVGLGLLTGIGHAALAAGEGQETLNRAARNFKGAFPADELDDFAGGLSKLIGVDDDNIVATLGLLGTFQVPKQDAKALALPIYNATEALKAQGVTADQVAIQVGKALQTGDPAALRRSGIILDQVAFKAADAAGRAKLLKDALNAQGGANAAEEFRKSLPGTIQALETATGNLVKKFGKGGINPFTGLIDGTTGFINLLNSIPDDQMAGITVVATAAGVALTGLAAQQALSALQAGRLAGENAKLLNEQLKAAKGADRQQAEEETDALAMEQAGGAAGALTSKLNPLTAAHDRAAAAAHRQADAESRLGGAGVQLPGASGRHRRPASEPPVLKPSELGPAVKGSAVKNRVVGDAAAKLGEEALEAEAVAVKQAGAKGGWLAKLKGLGKFGAPAAETAEIVAEGGAVAKGAGMLGKLKGGLPGIIAGVVADVALNALPEEGNVGVGKHLAKGAVEGAGWGAALGSVVPGLGTAAGAVLGGAAGAGLAGFGEWQKSQEAKAAPTSTAPLTTDPHLAALQQAVELLKSIEAKESPLGGYDRVSLADQKLATLRALGG